MIFNFFINNPPTVNGGVNRYIDFKEYCVDNNIECTFNLDRNNDRNIVDIDYYIQNNNIRGNLFFGGMRNYLNVYTNINKPVFVHNLMYAKLMNGVFFPMFMYKNRINIYNKSNFKYKYGMFTSKFDANYDTINDIIKIYNINKNDILFLDREDTLKLYGYKHITQDTEYLLNNVESIIDICSKYSTRHVFSRFIGECILCNKNIYYVSIDNELPNTFKLFNHIQYIDINKKNNTILYKIEYDNKYFLLNNYSSYIKYIYENFDKNILYYERVEDYYECRV